MIELINVRKVFNAGQPNEFVAVDGVSLVIDAEKTTVFRGPSGSGKTTLLSLIGCMARPTSGRIRLDDREITSLPERFLTEIRQKTFGFIFQQCNLIKGHHRAGERDAAGLPIGGEACLAEEPGHGSSRHLQDPAKSPVEGRVALRRGGPAGGHRPGPDQQPLHYHCGRADGKPGHEALPRVHGDHGPPEKRTQDDPLCKPRPHRL